ncbi:MAG: ATP synthase subunit C [Erysipelotrichaceae bacterium]|nr:ATP synthase subunit C [Erysipelotrichaceae bacterium]
MFTLIEMFLPLIAVILVILPLFMMLNKGPKAINAKQKLIAQVAVFTGVFILAGILQFNNIKASEEAITSINGTLAQGLGFIAAAIVTSFSAIGAGIAVAAAAPAAIGAISENSENFGKAIIFVALGEGVAIYGLLISILIINKL